MASSKQVTGTVQKFDKDAKELTLSNSDKKLKLGDSTQVMKNGQSASATDIHEGDQVRASYSGSGDVTQIEIMPSSEKTPGTGSSGTGSSGSEKTPGK
jgi:Cu/Ag efflux protein CusF